MVSERIKESPAAEFALNAQAGRLLLAESCLLYHIYVSEVECNVNGRSYEDELRNFFYLWHHATTKGICWYVERMDSRLWTQSLHRLVWLVLKSDTQSFRHFRRLNDKDALYWGELDWKEPPFGFLSPLHLALKLRLRQTFSYILDNDLCDINAIGGYFGTALNYACAKDGKSAATLLLDKGADLWRGNSIVRCALSAAISSTSFDSWIMSTLLDMPDLIQRCEKIGYNPLFDAASLFRADVSKQLILVGADPNQKSGDRTVLYEVFMRRQHCKKPWQMIEVLTKHGADINERCGQYGNILQHAIVARDYQFAMYCLQNGARLDPLGQDWDDLLEHIKELMAAEWLQDFQNVLGHKSRTSGFTLDDLNRDLGALSRTHGNV